MNYLLSRIKVMNPLDMLAQAGGLQKVSGQWLKSVTLPVFGLLCFVLVWHFAAKTVDTSLGQFPGPIAVWEQTGNLYQEYQAEKQREADFYQRQEQRNAERMAQDPTFEPRIRDYSGRPTFFDQIRTSIFTVFAGFILASIIAIPLGIAIGLSASLYAAVNPVIQLFKPVSPLAWLPLVTIVVSAVYVSDDPMFARSFLVSMITVTLCCLWPTLLNTSIGVSSVDQDLVNVGKVLRLNKLVYIQKIVLPSAIPMIFAGLRVSLGIAWMVLIAAEMLAQNPGLGKFVWDEFQNGSSSSLSRIMVAVLVIGAIGFVLDRIMLLIQKKVSWDKEAITR